MTLESVSLWWGTFLVCALSAVVPFMNSEIYLIALSTVAPPTQLPALVVAAAAGQMLGKSLLFLAGRGVLKLPFVKADDGTGWRRRLRAGGPAADGLVLISAFSGLPPFYAVSIGAGVLGCDFVRFLIAGTCGRLLRFALVVSLPQVLKGVWA